MALSAAMANIKTAAKRLSPKDVRVPVDATLKRRFDALQAVILAAKARGASAFDELWEAVAEVIDHDPPLYFVGAFKDAPEYFREVLGENQRNARRYMRVARYASPKDEQRYGVTKLDAALAFIEAKLGAPLAAPPLPVALDRLRIPIVEGKTKRTVRLDQATEEQVRAAVRALTKGPPGPKSAAQSALSTSLGRVKSLAEVRVRVKSGRATFTNVPLAALDQFARAVVQAKLPDEPAIAKRR